jgi:hypothetical protein
MSTIRFVLRKDKLLNNGTFPIDLIYQLHQQRKYFRTEIKLPETSWDEKKQIARYSNKKEVANLIKKGNRMESRLLIFILCHYNLK